MFEVNKEDTRIFTTKFEQIYLINYSSALFIALNIYLTAELSTGIHLFKVNNGKTRTIREICSKLTIKKP